MMASKLQSIKDDIPHVSLAPQLVRERAYQIWQRAGEPSGRDVEHWTQAERELRDEMSATELLARSGAVPAVS